MAHVPDDAVFWRIENMMKSDGKLNRPKSGSEMPAGDGNRIDNLRAQLVHQQAKGAVRQLSQVGWNMDRIQKWGFGREGRVF